MRITSARGEFRDERAIVFPIPNPTANPVSVFEGTCVNNMRIGKMTHSVSFF